MTTITPTFLRNRRSYVRVITLASGIPLAVFTLWIAGGYGDIYLWIFLVAIAIGGGWLFAVSTWFILGDGVVPRPPSRQSTRHPPAPVQTDGRIRRWAQIPEMESRYLRVVLLADGETVHNAFFDRSFRL